AWEQIPTLQRHNILAAGAAQLRSHAGAWERAQKGYCFNYESRESTQMFPQAQNFFNPQITQIFADEKKNHEWTRINTNYFSLVSSSSSHAPAWEQIPTLQRHNILAAGAA
ncbi:hypothetical protein, partial [Candidatus Thiosymbion oneisti]|uniref:hypothetical protein n=1 Tax=Candidatus Thiosymbion oneisti TaxID=589554 RepID=UPI001C405E87